MGNFYTGTPDLRHRIETTPWEQFLPLLESGFQSGDELAPENLEEAVEQIGMVLDLVGEMAANEIAPRAAEVDHIGARLDEGRVVYPEPMLESVRLLSEAGLMGFTLPREYGGMNLPVSAYTAAVEMVSRADASLMTLFALQGCGETIHRWGSEEIRERYLPRLCTGEISPSMALTEPNAGSALGSVMTRASLDDDGMWTIRGSKCFITNGGADLLLVLARTEATGGGEGLSLILVERGEGVSVAKLESKLGIHGSATAVVNFDDARGVLLGNRGGGLYECTLHMLHNVRLEVAAQAVGIAEAAQAQAARYAREREQFGRPIDRFAPVRSMLFENAVEIEIARAITMVTANEVDLRRAMRRAGTSEEEMHRHERIASLLTPLSKYYACEMVNEVTSRALQVHGGYGYTREYPVERHMRDGRITAIYEGTSEIQVGAMILPLLKGGLDLVFADRLAAASEPDGCEGALDRLGSAFERLSDAARTALDADHLAHQGWAKDFADATAELFAGLVFLRDAATIERAKTLARHVSASALRRASRVLEMVRNDERTGFDDESFETIVAPYRSAV